MLYDKGRRKKKRRYTIAATEAVVNSWKSELKQSVTLPDLLDFLYAADPSDSSQFNIKQGASVGSAPHHER